MVQPRGTSVSREAPVREEEIEPAQTPGNAEERDKTRAGSFLFDDPYWDDAFDSYHDPTLRTCCRN
jgi:hypothetical protein